MAWQDRLKEAAYISPDNVRIPFTYEDVSRNFDKKTSSYQFPDSSDTYVQDRGATGRKFPLRIFFWGDNYDIEAGVFESILGQKGIGRLEHPLYGVFDVVPFGTITRRDNLKSGANQAIIEVTFWETVNLIYPNSETDPSAEVLQSIEEYNQAAAQAFQEQSDLEGALEQATFKGRYLAVLDQTKAGLQSVADTQDNVKKQFDSIYNSINFGIDTLVADPLSLAFQTSLLIQSPGRAAAAITARLDAYGNLAQTLINELLPNDFNDFLQRDLSVSGYVTGAIISAVNNQFQTKTDALNSAITILDLFNDVNVWRESGFSALSQIDTGEAYQKLQEASAIAAGFLVQISFDLKQERRITLTRNRTIVDLVAELYGSVDDRLDFFIDSNDLSGSEILELPAGREIVYYV